MKEFKANQKYFKFRFTIIVILTVLVAVSIANFIIFHVLIFNIFMIISFSMSFISLLINIYDIINQKITISDTYIEYLFAIKRFRIYKDQIDKLEIENNKVVILLKNGKIRHFNFNFFEKTDEILKEINILINSK